MKKGYSYVISLIILSSFAASATDDTSLGGDGILHCAYSGHVLIDVSRVTLTHLSQEDQLILYSSGTNRSTDKYVLAADFYTITVRNVTVRDEGEYYCQLTFSPFGSPRTLSVETTLIVYGKQELTFHIRIGVRLPCR